MAEATAGDPPPPAQGRAGGAPGRPGRQHGHRRQLPRLPGARLGRGRRGPAVAAADGPATGPTGGVALRRRPGPLRRPAPARPPTPGGASPGRHPGRQPRWTRRTDLPNTECRRSTTSGTVALLTSLRPVVVVVNGTRIIAARVLESAGCPVVNLHAGITPRYRGVHGGYWALAERHPEWVGTTVHLVDPGHRHRRDPRPERPSTSPARTRSPPTRPAPGARSRRCSEPRSTR